MTNQDKIAYLRRYGYAVRKEQRLREEIAVWRSKAEKITPSVSGMPGGGGSQAAPFERAVDQIIKLEALLCAQLLAMANLRDSIEQLLATLAEDRLREVLELRYIEGTTWELVAVKMHYTYMHVCKLHGQALAALVMDKQ